MLVSSKYNDFLDTYAKVEFLEGTTSAGKTTVGVFKFMLDVAESKQSQHILAGLDTGTIEKNIISKPYGIIDEWGDLVEYKGGGTSLEKLPHLLFYTNNGTKKIYVLGYDDKARWKKALGNQYGVLYIDEINIANMEFVRESMMRCDKVIATLNPDDPALPIYKEYINHSRPLPQYAQDVPADILKELNEPAKEGWVHWFFGFKDNIALTPEKIQTIIDNVPAGTKLYKNKIQGIRCRATGLVFGNFSAENIISAKALKEKQKAGDIQFKRLVLGVDTSYSSKSPDTIAMELCGITTDGDLYTLEERTFNNAERNQPLAPSDVVREIVAFADFCRVAWGDFRNIFIDSADQATITECLKYKRENGCIYLFTPAYKDMKIIDRINLQLGWIAKHQYTVVDTCSEHIREMGVYSWQEDKDIPEDGNDHTINAVQYAWLPFVSDIG
jgi:PBSX family phage terminase large subunit